MKNVFGDSSDSDSGSESKPVRPPLKKFKPPPSIDLDDKDEQSRVSDSGSTDINTVVSVDLRNETLVRENSIQESCSDHDSTEEIDEEIDDLRPGLGSMSTPQSYNQKASLHESIIDERSIGLKIMQKMGYVLGQTIGSGTNTNALVEPLSIRAKAARTGIRENTFKPKVASDISSGSTTAYQEAVKNKHTERCNKAMVLKLKKYCLVASGEDLKLEHGEILVEDVNALWRDIAKPRQKTAKRISLFGENVTKVSEPADAPDSNLESTNDSLEQQLDDLVIYVRENFLYCPYCGTTYEDADDMAKNCPGVAESMHQL